MLAHKIIFEGFVVVVRSKNASPTWNDVKTALLDFDRVGLRGLVQDLYTANSALTCGRLTRWRQKTVAQKVPPGFDRHGRHP
jgi:hypothetical protein